MNKSFLILVFCMTSLLSYSQDYHLGLRIGLNYSNLNGPAEENAKYTSVSGFHVGPTFSYSFSDIMGLRGELVFSQKGHQLDYSGPSYFTIRKNNEYIPTTGTRTMRVVVSNNYIDLPIMFYTLLFERLDVSIGGYLSALVGSSGRGDISYNGKRDNSNATVGPIKFLLDHNYYKDKAGQAASGVTQIIKLEGDPITLPERLGAYYEYRTAVEGNKFNSLDYGLTGALHYRLTRGLYAGIRYQLGFSDISNNAFDISYQSLTATKEFIKTPQKQTHQGIQISLMLQL